MMILVTTKIFAENKMGIYRNEELLVGNHIAIPEFKDFKGRIVAYGKIRRVIPNAYMSYTIVELTMENENRFYLSEVSDFKTFKKAWFFKWNKNNFTKV